MKSTIEIVYSLYKFCWCGKHDSSHVKGEQMAMLTCIVAHA